MNFFTIFAIVIALILLWCSYILRESYILNLYRKALLTADTTEEEEMALDKIKGTLTTLKSMDKDSIIEFNVTGDKTFLVSLLDCKTADEMIEKIDSVL